MKIKPRFIFQFSAFILLDQITKVFFASRDFFVGFMHFHLVKNYGLSFGLNFGVFINFVIIIIAVVLFSIYIRKQNGEWGTVLVVAGAVGNLIDRTVLGFVRDFWDVGLGFTFNLADLFIIVGLVLLLFRKDK